MGATTTTNISRLLVANRGEIAVRVFRTCRRLGISTVAVYSEADADALHVREADLAVSIGGAAAADSYLRGEAVIEAALRSGADAIHPGYGFLAENAAFAERVIDAGLIWVGPQPEVIAAMGSKVSARALMGEAGVPVLPGMTIADQELPDPDEVADRIGFPVIVKASAGGGGKGMRIVEDPKRLADAIEVARREAAAAFGDDAIFLERYVGRSRHVEIQVVGDSHGNVVAFPERDCTVQRRHQKVIEESPSPAIDPDLRRRLVEAARAGARSLAYRGAGTFEFLFDIEREDFFFLEVNTRLQVEHPVTEAVMGVDLVELQIAVAEGRSLPVEELEREPEGHAVEARLYAEDPAGGFLPTAGTLWAFEPAGEIRFDSGVAAGATVTTNYDPMLAKLTAHGATRADAIRRLVDSLRRMRVCGLLTNRDFLVRILSDHDFASGEFDTGLIERRGVESLSEPLVADRDLPHYALAAALAAQAGRRARARSLAGIPSGWRNNPNRLQTVEYRRGDRELEVGYALDRGGRLAAFTVDGEAVDAPRLIDCQEDRVVLESAEGVSTTYRVAESGSQVAISTVSGGVELTEKPRFAGAEAEAAAGSLESPMPGLVSRVEVKIGDVIEVGAPLLAIEAMKMEHELTAPRAGVVQELMVAAGDSVEAGTALVVIDAVGTEDEDGNG